MYLKTNPGRGKEDEETTIKLLPSEDIIGMCWEVEYTGVELLVVSPNS